MNFGNLLPELGMAIAVFAVYFGYVFLRAMQQQNVIHGHYWMIAPVSMGMAFGDAYIITAVAEHGLRLWWAMGIGGFTGCWASMWAHRKMRKVNGSSKDKNIPTKTREAKMATH